MYFKQIFIIAIVIVGLSGCLASLYMPTDNDAKLSGTTLDTLKTGRTLYISKCGGCHNLYLPASYTKSEWVKITDKMQKRSKISNSENSLINKYLQINSK